MRVVRPISGALLGVVLAACGGGGGAPDAGTDARALDAAIDAAAAPDGSPACGRTWRYERRAASAIAAIDPAPLTTGRTARVKVTVALGPCEEPGMIGAGRAFEALTISIDVGVWVPVGGTCTAPTRTIERPVALSLETPGTWQITSGSATPLMLTVGAAPAHACGAVASGCDLDCDCAAGERCLGSTGFAGPVTSCQRACEFDRDCGGTGRCETIAPSLEFACSSDVECDADHACATGYTCTGGACAPVTTLSSATRVTCSCDDDCAPGLRCVEPTAGTGARRCEVACPSDGPWCSLGHVCGLAEADVAGLAASDSVCGWVGD